MECSKKTALRNKQRYDLKVRESTLQAGDRVLVRNVGIRGKHKIADRWSKTVYQVVKQITDSPVYVVKPLTIDGPERTLHRDLFLPCGFLTPAPSIDEDNRVERKGRTTRLSESQTVLEDVDEPMYNDDGEPEVYFPEIMQDKSYPTITIVKNVPYPRGVEGNSSETALNPNAQPFEPFEVNDVESEELISPRTKPVEGKRDGMRKEDNDLLTDDNVERNEHTPLHEVPELRRSTRTREQPDRITYKSLGSPLVLVMQSLLSGLNKASTQAFESDELPDVRILTPDRSMIL